jgi:dephospho-CoA kinase
MTGGVPRDAARSSGPPGRPEPRRTVRIGLTGPIGCGKSTVASWLGERGVVVVDADAIARSVTEPGGPALAAVIDRFGHAYERPDGSLDRAALGRLVFSDPTALRDLEAIVHPAVRPRILEVIAAAEAEDAPAVAVEAIKLVEGGLAALCDEVWLVTCDEAVQRDRVIGRGLNPADATRRIAAQRGLEARLRPVATRVIDTSGTLEELSDRLARAWDEVVSRSDRSSDDGRARR